MIITGIVENLKSQYLSRSTQELLAIWQTKGTPNENITEEGFEAIRQILVERQIDIPTPPEPVASKPSFAEIQNQDDQSMHIPIPHEIKECASILEQLGYRLITKKSGWKIKEPLGGCQNIQTIEELTEYTHSKQIENQRENERSIRMQKVSLPLSVQAANKNNLALPNAEPKKEVFFSESRNDALKTINNETLKVGRVKDTEELLVLKVLTRTYRHLLTRSFDFIYVTDDIPDDVLSSVHLLGFAPDEALVLILPKIPWSNQIVVTATGIYSFFLEPIVTEVKFRSWDSINKIYIQSCNDRLALMLDNDEIMSVKSLDPTFEISLFSIKLQEYLDCLLKDIKYYLTHPDLDIKSHELIELNEDIWEVRDDKGNISTFDEEKFLKKIKNLTIMPTQKYRRFNRTNKCLPEWGTVADIYEHFGLSIEEIRKHSNYRMCLGCLGGFVLYLIVGVGLVGIIDHIMTVTNVESNFSNMSSSEMGWTLGKIVGTLFGLNLLFKALMSRKK